jgi:hypothetical protein
MGTFEIGIGMHSIEIRLGVAVPQDDLRGELSEDSLSVWSSCTVHSIKHHLEIFSLKETLNSLKIEQFPHEFDIYSDGLDDLDDEGGLVGTKDIIEGIGGRFGQVDFMGDVLRGRRVLTDLQCLGVD